jgi:hypothetical protein
MLLLSWEGRMSELMWIRSHVRQLLAEEWGTCCVGVDPDGDVPFRRGTAAGWVSVLDSAPAMVRVFAHAAYGVRSSAKLLRQLNDVQRGSLSARVEFSSGVVLVSQTVNPVGLTGPVLGQAVEAVGGLADEIGCLVAALYDGATPFDAELDVDEEAS